MRKKIFLTLALFSLLLSWPLTAEKFANPDLRQIDAWIQLGKGYSLKGDFQRSSEYFNKCLSDASLRDPEKLECYMILGIIYWNIDQIKTSTNFFIRAFDLATKLGLQKQTRYCRDILEIHKFFLEASGSRDQKNLPQSNSLFDKALNMAISINSRPHELKILRVWSINYSGYNDAEKLREFNQRALDLSLILNHKTETIRAYNNLGSFYAIKKSYSRALSCYTKGLAYAQDIKDEKAVMSYLNNLSFLYISFGDYQKAQEYIAQALKSSDQNASPVRTLTNLINLGQIYHNQALATRSQEDYSTAMNYFKTVIDRSLLIKSPALLHFANIEFAGLRVDNGQFDLAQSILSPEYEYYKKHEDPARFSSVLFYLGLICLKQNSYQKAASYFDESARQSRTVGSHLLTIKALFKLGACQESLGHPERTLSAYGEALDLIDIVGSSIVDDMNRSEFNIRQREIYETAINFNFERSVQRNSRFYEYEVFRNIERMKARSFLEFLERQELSKEQKTPKGPTETEEKLKRERLEGLRQLSFGNLDQTRRSEVELGVRRIDDMLSALTQDVHLADKDLNIFGEPSTLEQIQTSILNPNTALIEYFLGDQRSFLFFISKSSFKLFELPPARAIRESLIPYLAYLQDPGISIEKGILPARHVFKELMSPIENDLSNMEHLIIVPDGILFDLPFETLVLNQDGASANRYLLNRYTISYAPSASALCFLKKRRAQTYKKELLAFGVPVDDEPKRSDSTSAGSIMADWFSNKGFAAIPIPYVKKEIETISKFFKAKDKDIIVGQNATETAFKNLDLGNYRVVHLACHAFSDEEFPLQSAFMFSPDDKSDEDGFFQVLEMLKIRLKADLVVLSACKTAKGKNILNEGVLGLPRIFFYMGSRSVISTLWPIADKATVQFMGYFYSYYTQGNSKAQALSLAKVKMLSTRYSHPYYWASFILTGEY